MYIGDTWVKIFLIFLVLFLVSGAVAEFRYGDRADAAKARTDMICNTVMHSNANSTTIEIPEVGQGIVTLNDKNIQEIDCSKLEQYDFHRSEDKQDFDFGIIHAVGLAIFSLILLIAVYIARSGRFIGEYPKILLSPLPVSFALYTLAIIFDNLTSTPFWILIPFSVLGTLLTPVVLPLYVWRKSNVEDRRMDALIAFAVSLLNLLILFSAVAFFSWIS